MTRVPVALGVAGVALLAWAAVRPAPPPDRPAAPRFRRLTWDDARELSPTISPNGENVAFVRGATLAWMKVGGGRAFEMSHEEEAYDPVYSPDGRELVFSTDHGLWVVDAAGGTPRRLLDHGHQASFRPDGRLLVAGETWTNPFAVGGEGAIGVLDPATSVVTPVGDLSGFHPVASPDGAWIAYWSAPARRVWVARADGTDAHPVAGDGELAAWRPRWSPDGRWLWYLTEAPGTTDLWRVALVDGAPAGPAEPVTSGFADEIHSWDWSADGTRLVLDADTRTSAIVRVDPATGRVTPLVRGRQVIESADLSWDGAALVYDARGRRQRIWWSRADGTQVRVLTEGQRSRDPRFSPDGRTVAFQRLAAGVNHVFTVGSDGTGLRDRMADAERGGVEPEWRPDGSFLAKCANDLCAFPADGGPFRVLTPGPPRAPLTPQFERRPGGRVLVPLAFVADAVEIRDAETWALERTVEDAVAAAFRDPDHLLVLAPGSRALFEEDRVTGARREVVADLGGPPTDVITGPGDAVYVLLRWQASDVWVVDL